VTFLETKERVSAVVAGIVSVRSRCELWVLWLMNRVGKRTVDGDGKFTMLGRLMLGRAAYGEAAFQSKKATGSLQA
jgi:hypothetical protein